MKFGACRGTSSRVHRLEPEDVIHDDQVNETFNHQGKTDLATVKCWGCKVTTLAEIMSRRDRKRAGEYPCSDGTRVNLQRGGSRAGFKVEKPPVPHAVFPPMSPKALGNFPHSRHRGGLWRHGRSQLCRPPSAHYCAWGLCQLTQFGSMWFSQSGRTTAKRDWQCCGRATSAFGSARLRCRD